AYQAQLLAVFKSAVRMVRTSALFDATTKFAVTIGQLIVLGVGGYLAIDGKLQLGVLVAFFGVLPSLLMPLSQFTGVGQAVQQSSGSLSRVAELLDVPVTIEDKPAATALPPVGREIRLEDVRFEYEPGRTILSDF